MTLEARTGSTHHRGELHHPDQSFRSTRRCRAGGLLLAASLWAGAAAAPAQAAEPAPGAGDPEPVAHVHGQGSAAGAGEHARMGRHHVMLMASQGVTDGGTRTFSAGLGYEYRLPFLENLLGVGAMAEVMLMSAAHQMLMATAAIHPLQELSLQVAVGVTHLHREATATGSGRSMSSQAVVRASAGYAFHLGTLMLAPYVNADVARKPRLAVSAGLCAGFMF